jgi:hypothetical protein
VFTIEDDVEFRKQSVLGETEEAKPEPKQRTMMVSDWTGRLGLKESEDIAWNEQRPAATSQGIIRMLGCYEEILKERRSLPRQTSVLDLFKSPSGTLTSQPVLLHIAEYESDHVYSPRRSVSSLRRLLFFISCLYL